MTQKEKSQAQDVLNGLLRDSYQQGYNQGFKDGLEVGESNKASKPAPAPPTDGAASIRDGHPTDIKVCLDCRHCETRPSYGQGLSENHICRLASKVEPSPVTGRRCYTERVHCWKEREDGSCGPEGRNFERRQRRLKGGLLDWIFPGMLPW